MGCICIAWSGGFQNSMPWSLASCTIGYHWIELILDFCNLLEGSVSEPECTHTHVYLVLRYSTNYKTLTVSPAQCNRSISDGKKRSELL
jgi:hypothetical protein